MGYESVDNGNGPVYYVHGILSDLNPASGWWSMGTCNNGADAFTEHNSNAGSPDKPHRDGGNCSVIRRHQTNQEVTRLSLPFFSLVQRALSYALRNDLRQRASFHSFSVSSSHTNHCLVNPSCCIGIGKNQRKRKRGRFLIPRALCPLVSCVFPIIARLSRFPMICLGMFPWTPD